MILYQAPDFAAQERKIISQAGAFLCLFNLLTLVLPSVSPNYADISVVQGVLIGISFLSLYVFACHGFLGLFYDQEELISVKPSADIDSTLVEKNPPNTNGGNKKQALRKKKKNE